MFSNTTIRKHAKTGQAVVELAVFGSLILFAFGIVYSFLQQFNDQQYVKMEAFRRGLEKACHGPDGAGASVQYTVLANRHFSDLSSDYKKGNTGLVSGSSSIYWAVPKLQRGVKAKTITYFKVNEEEQDYDNDDYISEPLRRYDEEGEERNVYQSFVPGSEIDFDSSVQFTENTQKAENPTTITNTRSSTLNETIGTTLYYEIRQHTRGEADKDGTLVTRDVLWAPVQGAYRDSSDGQYKYSTSAVGTDIVRGRSWETDF